MPSGPKDAPIKFCRDFGWSKLDRPLRQVKLRGLKRVDWFYRLTLAAYNMVRMRRLIPLERLAG